MYVCSGFCLYFDHGLSVSLWIVFVVSIFVQYICYVKGYRFRRASGHRLFTFKTTETKHFEKKKKKKKKGLLLVMQVASYNMNSHNEYKTHKS